MFSTPLIAVLLLLSQHHGEFTRGGIIPDGQILALTAAKLCFGMLHAMVSKRQKKEQKDSMTFDDFRQLGMTCMANMGQQPIWSPSASARYNIQEAGGIVFVHLTMNGTLHDADAFDIKPLLPFL